MHKEIEGTIKELNQIIDKVKGWNEVANDMQIIVDNPKFKDLMPVIRIGHGISSVRGVLVKVYPKRFSEVTAILKAMTEAGYHQHRDPDDYAEVKRRTWHFYKKEDGVDKPTGMFSEGGLKLMAFFQDGEGDDQICKFVKVGVKEEPVYELQCNEVV